jgi:hypothetical protein
MKTYLEWLPNRFQQARDEGLLDTPTKHDEEVPSMSWIKRVNPKGAPLAAIDKFSAYDNYHNYRLIVFNNHFISDSAFVSNHSDLVHELAKRRLVYITPEEAADSWYELIDIDKFVETAKKFICMQMSEDNLYFSESYAYYQVEFLIDNINYHKGALKKIGMKLQERPWRGW